MSPGFGCLRNVLRSICCQLLLRVCIGSMRRPRAEDGDGAQKKADGTFMCWTFDGEMTITDANQPAVVLQPHETTAVQPGFPNLGVRPIHLNVSTLRITTSGAVLPLLEMPDKARVAGFVVPGAEVNQVFGS